MAKYMAEIPADAERVTSGTITAGVDVTLWDGSNEHPADVSLWVIFADATWAQVATKKWQDLGMWGNLMKETEI